MVSIGQYIIYHTRMILSYRTINRITQLIVYAGKNSVVVILVGTDGHGHDNIHIIISISIPNSLLSFHCQHTNPLLSFHYTFQHHHIIINNNRKRRRREARCSYRSHHSAIQYITYCIQHTIYILHDKKQHE